MDIDKIKDIIIARYRFIASNAMEIAKLAQNCSEEVMVCKDTLDEIDSCIDDIGANIFSFRQMLKALEVEEKEEIDE